MAFKKAKKFLKIWTLVKIIWYHDQDTDMYLHREEIVSEHRKWRRAYAKADKLNKQRKSEKAPAYKVINPYGKCVRSWC